MKPTAFWTIPIWVAAFVASGVYCSRGRSEPVNPTRSAPTIQLPTVPHTRDFPVERALAERRSVREYGKRVLSMDEIAYLLWAAQGITHPQGLRTAPSAGALYPLEIYLVVGKGNGLDAGVYHYHPKNHELIRILGEDLRAPLCSAALDQSAIKEAPVIIVITAVYARTTGKYGDRGIRYVHMEAGHAAQNIALQAVALGLGTVPIGAFDDEEVQKVIQSASQETPLYIMPIGAL